MENEELKAKLEKSIKLKLRSVDMLRHQDKVDEDRIKELVDKIDEETYQLYNLLDQKVQEVETELAEAVAVDDKLEKRKLIYKHQQENKAKIRSLFNYENVDEKDFINQYDKNEEGLSEIKELEADQKLIEDATKEYNTIQDRLERNQKQQEEYNIVEKKAEELYKDLEKTQKSMLPTNIDEVKAAYEEALEIRTMLREQRNLAPTLINKEKTQYEADIALDEINNEKIISEYRELIALEEILSLINKKTTTFEELLDKNDKILRLIDERYNLSDSFSFRTPAIREQLLEYVVKTDYISSITRSQLKLRENEKTLQLQTNEALNKLRNVRGTFKMNTSALQEEAQKEDKNQLKKQLQENSLLEQKSEAEFLKEQLQKNPMMGQTEEVKKAMDREHEEALKENKAKQSNKVVSVPKTAEAELLKKQLQENSLLGQAEEVKKAMDKEHEEALKENAKIDAKNVKINPNFAVKSVADPSDKVKKASPKKFLNWKLALAGVIAALAVSVVTYMPAIKEAKEKLTGKPSQTTSEQKTPVLGFNNQKPTLTVDELGNIKSEPVAEEKTSVKEEKKETVAAKRPIINIEYLRPGAKVDLKANSYTYIDPNGNDKPQLVNEGKAESYWCQGIVVVNKMGIALGYISEPDKSVDQIIKEAKEKNPKINLDGIKAVGHLSKNAPESKTNIGVKGEGYWIDLGEYATNYDNSAINTIAADDKETFKNWQDDKAIDVDVDALEDAQEKAKKIDDNAKNLVAENEAKVKGMKK